ncbi:PI-PLC X domain-containing protein 1 [Alosa sapidissima]|uniref:PI-PLC X domain-containing protein 1 n=1 Tax=Alosa sapidissima TaxID=34773 RepID=UPI001C08DBD6|nr:PI-PLC X domain-containing protein 1 [Alosa sapidissima]
MDLTESDSDYGNWMSALSEELWDIPLSNLAIPGSHDTMSYCLDITSPLVRSESDAFRILDGLFYCFTRPVIYRWATTQEKDIVEQLQAGIRYFDLRIAHKPNDKSDELYFTHVIYTHVTVLETLQKIASWLDSHPKEIVILACRNFQGLSEKLHEAFIYSLRRTFASKLCPHTEAVVTLRHLWSLRYQVVLSYDDQTAARHNELWPAIPYLWANKPTAEGLIDYLEWQKSEGRPDGFFVAGLNLTAGRCFIASHPHESLRSLSVENWDGVRQWLKEQRPGPGHSCLNIIAGDFVGLIPFCHLIIALNKKLIPASQSHGD